MLCYIKAYYSNTTILCMIIGMQFFGMQFFRELSEKKKVWLGLAVLIILFTAIRLPGPSLPYHHDEFKTAWAILSGKSLGGLHHPPPTQIFLNLDGALFGADHMRILPLSFSIITFLLLFFVVKGRAGRKEALFAVGLFAVSSYSVLASLMVDTDGAILPAFFLLAVYFYDKFKKIEGKRAYKWPIFLVLALILGFMTKLSFVIAIGAVILDFFLDKYKDITRRQVSIGILALFGFLGLSALLVLLIHLIYPTFDISAMISHASSYVHLEDRNYFQSIIQGVKSLYYLSPLLLAPLLFINAEIWRKTRIFCLYLILGFVFYFIVFDFSSGALDKYVMFTIVPFAVISGVILGNILDSNALRRRGAI